MIPSKRWFPTTLADRAAWMNNFARNFATVALSLGFSAADITSMTQDNEDFQAVARALIAAEAYISSLRLYRTSLTEEKPGSPQPHFPNLSVTPPPNGVPAGIFQRLDDRVQRIRTAAVYTDEIGALLGIIPTGPQPFAASAHTPEIKAIVLPGNIVHIRFTRADAHGLFVEMRLDKETDWTDVGRFVRSPAVIQVPDGTGAPRAAEFRARYLIGNDPVGQNSNIINVVTTPK